MSSSSNGSGAASDAEVRTGGEADDQRARALREQLADEAEAAVKLREQTIKDLQESLKVAKAEAKRLRAETGKGGSE